MLYCIFLAIKILQKNYTVYPEETFVDTVFFYSNQGSYIKNVVILRKKYSIYEPLFYVYCIFEDITPSMDFKLQ